MEWVTWALSIVVAAAVITLLIILVHIGIFGKPSLFMELQLEILAIGAVQTAILILILRNTML